MTNLKRNIRLFLIRYGRFLLYMLGIILFVLVIIQTFNDEAINKKEYENKLNYKTEEEKALEEKLNEEENKKLSHISSFIYFCNDGKISEAYDLLSTKCKQEKYKTIEEFEENYVKKVFNIHICDYKIQKKEDIYEVTLIQDILITGNKDNVKVEKYKLEWVLEKRLDICT